MTSSIVFLLGCWIGCIAGFLLAGLMTRSKTEEVTTAYSVSLEESKNFPATTVTK